MFNRFGTWMFLAFLHTCWHPANLIEWIVRFCPWADQVFRAVFQLMKLIFLFCVTRSSLDQFQCHQLVKPRANFLIGKLVTLELFQFLNCPLFPWTMTSLSLNPAVTEIQC